MFDSIEDEIFLPKREKPSMHRPSWDELYISMCYLVAQRSKDMSTHAGCVIVNQDNIPLSIGYNDLPRGIDFQGDIGEDGVPSRQSRIDGEKYLWFEHGERNAIYNAGRTGTSLIGATLYINWIPCIDCARGIMQSGVSMVIIHAQGQKAFEHSRGHDDEWSKDNVWSVNHSKAVDMMRESGVDVTYYYGTVTPGTFGFFSGKKYEFDKNGVFFLTKE